MVSINDISDTLFDHLNNQHKIPVEKLKVMISEYSSTIQDQANKINELENEYNENFESKRIIQDQMYTEFVAERKELYKKWLTDGSQDTLYDMINMKFDYQHIPDIFVRRDITSNNRKFKVVAPKPDIKKLKKKAEQPKPVIPKAEQPKPVIPKAEQPKPVIMNNRCGIKNLGNSCYINSTLQYLIHLPAFNDIIKDQGESQNNIVKAYFELYETYMNKNINEDTIMQLVNNLNASLNDADKFDVSEQFDAFEFMLKLLEKMNIKELSDLFKINIESLIEFEKTIKKGKKELRCDENKSNNTEETSVIIRFENKKTVYDMATELTKVYDGIKEEVDKKSEFVDCDKVVDTMTEKAQAKTEKFPHIRTEKITTYPQVLRVMYNIFDNKLKKIFVKSEIPNIWEHNNQKYKLNGIIVHFGESMSSGHYEYYSYEDGQWYEYSDSSVKPYKATKPLKTSHYSLSTNDNVSNVFYTSKSMPCPYILSYIKM
jgi:ubiquitin C-terminal hydrolase